MAETEWYGICNEKGELLMNRDGEQFIAPNLALAQEIAISLQQSSTYLITVRRLDEAPMTEEEFIAKQRMILEKVWREVNW